MAVSLKLKHSDRWRDQFAAVTPERVTRFEWAAETFESGTVGTDWTGAGVDPSCDWQAHPQATLGGYKVQSTQVETGTKAIRTNQAAGVIPATGDFDVTWGILTYNFMWSGLSAQRQRISVYLPSGWPGPTITGSAGQIWFSVALINYSGELLVMAMVYKALTDTWELSYFKAGGAASTVMTGIPALALGTWHHFEVEYDSADQSARWSIDDDVTMTYAGTLLFGLSSNTMWIGHAVLTMLAAPANDMPDIYFDNYFFSGGVRA